MKKIIAISLGIVLVFCLCGCGGASEPASIIAPATAEPTVTPTSKPAPTEEPVPETPAPKYPPESALEAFIFLSDQVGIMKYSDCNTEIESWGIDFTATSPSNDTVGEIVIPDDHGFHLSVYFSLDKEYYQTICLVSYSNGDYEISASDNYHSSRIEYNTYDISREPRNKKVFSKDELLSFIGSIIPLTVEEEPDNSEQTTIEVTLDPSFERKDGKVYFSVHTNLPNGTTLMLTLTNGDYTGQEKVTVKDGVAQSSGFANKENELKGHYSLDITMPLPKLQSASVMEMIGTKGEYLSGDYVEYDSSMDSNTITGSFGFDF